jgi:hypothetical protein
MSTASRKFADREWTNTPLASQIKLEWRIETDIFFLFTSYTYNKPTEAQSTRLPPPMVSRSINPQYLCIVKISRSARSFLYFGSIMRDISRWARTNPPKLAVEHATLASLGLRATSLCYTIAKTVILVLWWVILWLYYSRNAFWSLLHAYTPLQTCTLISTL